MARFQRKARRFLMEDFSWSEEAEFKDFRDLSYRMEAGGIPNANRDSAEKTLRDSAFQERLGPLKDSCNVWRRLRIEKDISAELPGASILLKKDSPQVNYLSFSIWRLLAGIFPLPNHSLLKSARVIPLNPFTPNCPCFYSIVSESFSGSRLATGNEIPIGKAGSES